MKSIQLKDAKACLSRIVDETGKDEEFVITRGLSGKRGR